MEPPPHESSSSTSVPPSGSPATTSLTPLQSDFWQRTCALIRPKIGSEFDRWFGGLSAVANADGEIVIAVPNAIHQLWIESNYYGVLNDALRDACGGPRKIKFSLRPGHSAPAVVPPGEAREAALKTLSEARDAGGVTQVVRTPESLAEAGLSPKFTFENYIVGPANSYSAVVAKAVAEKPGRIYNPLFLHSEPGLGKTHLLHAIGREIMFRKKRAVVRYVTSEAFTNDFLEAIKRHTFSQFRAKYRKVDVLLIDDVQFFAGKDSTQEEFFHTFNDLFNNTKQIVLASDKAPHEIKNLESRLVSRFQWGLTTQIQMPDFETRVAILRRKMEDTGAPAIEPWVLDFIAHRVRNDVRRLEGCVMRVAAQVSVNDGASITEPELEALLSGIIDNDSSRAVNPDRIQRVVCERFDIRMAEMLGRARPKVIAEARQVAMYLTRDMAKLSLVEVGNAFGGRDHGTVIHACKVITARMEQSEDFRKLIADIRSRVLAP